MKTVFWAACTICFSYYIYYILIRAYYLNKKIIPKSNFTINNPLNKQLVSVIVPARNEKENIINCLDSLKQQSHPNFEVWVVDDQSTDETATLVKDWITCNGLNNFHILKILNNISSSKKYALQKGIESAQGDVIITTDADCLHPREWIERMTSRFSNEVDYVAGPVRLAPTPTFGMKFQALDSMAMVVVGAASFGMETPNLCNGANIAFKRSVFFAVNGFEGNKHLASGDDIFLLLKVARAGYKIAFAWDAKALVDTLACKSVGSFVQQRIRWVSKTTNYSSISLKAAMALIYFTNLFFLILLTYSAFQRNWLSLVSLWLGKSLIDLFLIFPCLKLMQRTRWIALFLLFQPLHALYVVVFGTIAILRPKYSWKGRKLS